MRRLLTGIGLSILVFLPAVADAQILVAGEGPVVYGHTHLNTTNMDTQKRLYVDTLGGTLAKIDSGDRQQVPQIGIAVAFIKDPWGTNIEMTEGLADIK